MQRLTCLFLAALAGLGFSGCLQIEQVIKLKPDGSGTVEETLLMSKEAVASMQQMASGFGGKADAGKGFELLDEKKLKEQAAKMGEGVTFVSAKKIDTEKSEGFAAVYAFADINKLKVDQNPGSAMPGPMGGKSPDGGKSKKEQLLFKFAKGRPAELTITMPKPDEKAAEKKPQMEGMEDMAMQMMGQMFKDMKVTIAVEVVGTIEETNAEYRDGSRVTLMEMDFNKLLSDPAKFKALAKENPKTLQEAKVLLKGLDGVKVEAAPVVKIKF